MKSLGAAIWESCTRPDTDPSRFVALQFLQQQLAKDPQAVERFRDLTKLKGSRDPDVMHAVLKLPDHGGLRA